MINVYHNPEPLQLATAYPDKIMSKWKAPAFSLYELLCTPHNLAGATGGPKKIKTRILINTFSDK